MIKKSILVGILCVVLVQVGVSSEKVIWPVADFTANFCNFPQAWEEAKGKDVHIGIVYDETEEAPDWLKRTIDLAPEAEISRVEVSEFLNLSPGVLKSQVCLIFKEIGKDRFPKALKAIRYFVKKGVAVILPAYFGPMKEDYDYKEWRTFINAASAEGAIIAGTHGRFYQLGNLTFWKEIPVDIFVLNTWIDGDEYFKPEVLIKVDLESAVYKAAAAAALLKSRDPNLTPQDMRQVFREKGRYVVWAHIRDSSEWDRAFPYLSKNSMEKDAAQFNKDKTQLVEVYEGRTLDAGLLMGLPPMLNGEWARQVLNITAARQLAAGRGVKVAILDHLFHRENPALKNRLYRPGSVVAGEPVFSQDGHGTWMAEDLVKIAPRVKIMPVRIRGKGDDDYTTLYIKGIEYAVANGADIISLSHRPVPKERQGDLDDAIEKASQKGVTFVYIHYYGDRKDVVRPGPIEFANSDEGEYVYVVGTNFINESAFPATWGLSPTAPIVAGVIAMMKEKNPRLKPMEIRQILLNSTNPNPEGYPLLDALKAVKNAGGWQPQPI